MPLTAKDERTLEHIAVQLKPLVGTKRREDFFPLLYLPRKFGGTPEEWVGRVAFGSNDYGIDAYHIDREARNLYLFQFKWSENSRLFADSLVRLSDAGMARIFGDEPVDPLKNDLIRSLRADLTEHRNVIDHVYIQFIFKGDIETAEKSDGLQERREQLETKAHLLERCFGRPVRLAVEFLSDRRTGHAGPVRDSYALEFASQIQQAVPEGPTMHVGFVLLRDLHGIYKGLGERFFNRNIRAGLSPDNPPNRKIRAALADIVLKRSSPAELFALHHNGVTLAVEHATFDNGRAILHAPRLLNGAQTVSSFSRFMEENADNPKIAADDSPLLHLRVLTKLIVADPSSDQVTRVTIANNQQNPVMPWNLRANDRIQCDLQDKFREEGKLYYERQENSIRGLTDSELEEQGIDDDRPITIRPLAQALLAVQGEVPTMSQLREVFENDKLYAATFSARLLQADVKQMVLIYKVGLLLRPVVKRMEERATQRLGAVLRRARNLTWALLVQGVLNDENLSDNAEAWGVDLTREQPLRDYLGTLGTSRVLPILRDIFGEPANDSKIEENRLDFVMSKETYRQCMAIAERRFKWRRCTW